MDPSEPKPVIAFFDVDNTLLRGASLYHVAIGAWRLGKLPLRDVLRFFWQQRQFIRRGENLGHLSDVRDRALTLIAGHTEVELRNLSEDTFDRRLAQRLWPETVALTKEHLAKGHQVWLVSATAQDVAAVIAERLGLTGALGTVFESTDGVFTGNLVGPVCHGSSKADAAGALARELDSDAATCWAYSDSHNDIPLLELVGNPVAVNPDHTLTAHAGESRWPILRMHPSSIRTARRRAKEARP
jgi:HAD superfamily hydrolase (TIGR01490 family)